MNLTSTSGNKSALRAATQRIPVLIGYGVALGFAFYVRIFSNLGALADPRVSIQDLDSVRYFRLIELIAHNYPSLPMFDSFANFPWGMKAQLPPIWAFIQASFGVLANRIFGVPVTSAAALFPVIFGLLLPIPAYFAGRYLFGKAAGHAAALISLFLPVASGASSLGMVDHHVADLVLYMTTIALLAAANSFHSKGERRRADALAALAGLALTFTLLISLSSILVVLILTATFLLGLAILPDGERRQAFRLGWLSLGSGGTSMLALYAATPWFERGFSFSYLSLLQPAILLSAAALVGIGRVVDEAFSRRYRPPLIERRGAGAERAIFLFALYAAALTAALTVPGIGEQISRGFYRSIGYYPLGRITKQLWPLFAEGTGEFTLRFSIFGYFLPVGFAYAAFDAFTKRRLDMGRLIFLCWFALAGGYYIASRYYAFLFAPAAFASLGFVIARLSNSIGIQVAKAIKGVEAKKAAFFAWVVTSTSLASYLVIWTLTGLSAPKPDTNWIAMLKWIKENTPVVSGFYDPNSKPEYGIATDWFYGEFVELVSERPTLSTANHETGIRGIIVSHEIMQAEAEEKLVSLMERYKLRYLVLRRPFPAWIGDVERIGEPGPQPEQIAYLPSFEPPEEAARLASVRLYSFWGGSDDRAGIEPMQRLRLIKTTGPANGRNYKLFELVKGVRLIVRTAPGATVTVETSLRSENMPTVPWKLRRSAGSDGAAVFYLPYPTNSVRSPVKADTYRVTARGISKTLEISEKDVEHGVLAELVFSE